MCLASRLFGLGGDFIINLLAKSVGILTDAIPKGNAHGNGADIQIFLSDHADRFEDVLCIDHWDNSIVFPDELLPEIVGTYRGLW